MSSIDMEKYKQLFLEELDEQLEMLDAELLRMEKDGHSDAGIQAIFRAAHTIKGSSAAMGFDQIKLLTHEMEQVLDRVRNRRMAVNAGLIDALFKCLDALRVIRNGLSDGVEADAVIEPLIHELRGLAEGPESADSHSHKTYVVHVTIMESCEMKLARCIVIHNKLQEFGEVTGTVPAIDQESDDELYRNIQFTCASDRDADDIATYLRSLMDVEHASVTERSAKPTHNEGQPAGTNGTAELSRGKQTAQSIRVGVEQLESLMNLVGELVIAQTRMSQLKDNLLRTYHLNEDAEELKDITDTVHKVVAELQNSVMKIRMLPIEQLFNRFPRMVRDLSISLKKKVELTLSGTETELDRSIIEEIGDPLIHLIRNALDHGIESPEERIGEGKNEVGQLRIAAAHEDNQVVITVEDDGAGIDPAKVKRSAVDKGVISAEEAERLSDHEAIHLIFRPGFSTAKTVSEVSGRGVGMDIVRSDIERLNGMIDIETALGQGTRFVIKLPLTLAIITGLLVKVSGRTYIIPMSNVAEIVRTAPGDIKTVQGKEIIVNRDRVITVIRMHDYFRYEMSANARRQIPLVIGGNAEQRVAIAVDELVGYRDIVIKPLGSIVGRTEFIAGATILGDGSVAFILDVADLMRLTKKNER